MSNYATCHVSCFLSHGYDCERVSASYQQHMDSDSPLSNIDSDEVIADSEGEGDAASWGVSSVYPGIY